MNIKVYLDDLFIINSIFTVLITETSYCLFKHRRKVGIVKRLLVCMLQSFLYIVVLYASKGRIMYDRLIILPYIIFSCLIMSVHLTETVMCEKIIVTYIRNALLLIMVTFLYGGIVNWFFSYTYFMLWAKKYLVRFIFLGATAFILCIGVRKMLIHFQGNRGIESIKCKVYIWLGDDMVCADGIIDSGNSLYEPESLRPVSIVEQSVIRPLLHKTVDKVYVVPFKSIGRENGSLYAIEFDKMDVVMSDTCFTKEKVLIGIFKGKLSCDGRYTMLLNGEYMNN